jgi:hypothetical protein
LTGAMAVSTIVRSVRLDGDAGLVPVQANEAKIESSGNSQQKHEGQHSLFSAAWSVRCAHILHKSHSGFLVRDGRASHQG